MEIMEIDLGNGQIGLSVLPRSFWRHLHNGAECFHLMFPIIKVPLTCGNVDQIDLWRAAAGAMSTPPASIDFFRALIAPNKNRLTVHTYRYVA
jgi:hypothetical protein